VNFRSSACDQTAGILLTGRLYRSSGRLDSGYKKNDRGKTYRHADLRRAELNTHVRHGHPQDFFQDRQVRGREESPSWGPGMGSRWGSSPQKLTTGCENNA